MQEKIVVGVVGMPGSGKSLVTETAKNMGFLIVVMGDVVREEAKCRGIEPTPENIGKLMVQLREEYGPDVIAKRCTSKIQYAPENFVLIDGLRNLEEVEFFKRYFKKFTLIAIHASPQTRFQRLFKRKRSDAPADWKSFLERDLREIKVGIGGVIALADYMIVNEETVEKCKIEIQKVLEKVLEYERSKRKD
jgi:dephospho-CoA kinase